VSKGDDRRRAQRELLRGGNADERAARAPVEEPAPRLNRADPSSWASTCAGWRGGFHERARTREGVPMVVDGQWRCRWCFQLFDPE
jgi:hypothetical protein